MKEVTCCKDCPFYDDGHGNGSYCSGMDVGPSSCKHPQNKKRGRSPNNEKSIPKWCPLRVSEYKEVITTHIKLKK